MPRKSSKRRWYSVMLASGPMYGPGSGQVSSGVITLSSAISGRSRSQSPLSKQSNASWTRWTYWTYPSQSLARLSHTTDSTRLHGTNRRLTLTDGGQSADDVAHGSPGFLHPAKSTLELALYDVRLPDPTGSIVADELRAASDRGVATRLLYNVDSGRPSEIHPPPSTRPEILAELSDRRPPGCRESRT